MVCNYNLCYKIVCCVQLSTGSEAPLVEEVVLKLLQTVLGYSLNLNKVKSSTPAQETKYWQNIINKTYSITEKVNPQHQLNKRCIQTHSPPHTGYIFIVSTSIPRHNLPAAHRQIGCHRRHTEEGSWHIQQQTRGGQNEIHNWACESNCHPCVIIVTL